MKNNTKPSFYYSAYPLKTIEQAALEQGEKSPHLKALLSSNTKPANRIRIYPMTNPYKSKNKVSTPRPGMAKNVEPDGKDWFHNYE
jgi:hypothetical protein